MKVRYCMPTTPPAGCIILKIFSVSCLVFLKEFSKYITDRMSFQDVLQHRGTGHWTTIGWFVSLRKVIVVIDAVCKRERADDEF